MAVAVESLVQRRELAEMGGRPARGGAALEVASQCGSVVGEGANGELPQVEVVSHDVEVKSGGGLFRVAVCESASWVFPGDQEAAQGRRERRAPNYWRLTFRKVHASCPEATGVHGPYDAGLFRDDFGESSGPFAEGSY